jgi:hypothetical protein
MRGDRLLTDRKITNESLADRPRPGSPGRGLSLSAAPEISHVSAVLAAQVPERPRVGKC